MPGDIEPGIVRQFLVSGRGNHGSSRLEAESLDQSAATDKPGLQFLEAQPAQILPNKGS